MNPFKRKGNPRPIRRVGDYWTNFQEYRKLDRNVAAFRLQHFFKSYKSRRERARRLQDLFQFKR